MIQELNRHHPTAKDLVNSPAKDILTEPLNISPLAAPHKQSAPTPMLLIMRFLAHWLIFFSSGFHKNQCLQLGEGAEAELQEEALSHQAPPRF